MARCYLLGCMKRLPRQLWKSLAIGDHPIVWSHCRARGRVFYSALGHGAATYARPEHARMLEGAIAWAAGLAGECP
jgi:type 1 glutamine amidotransferase